MAAIDVCRARPARPGHARHTGSTRARRPLDVKWKQSEWRHLKGGLMKKSVWLLLGGMLLLYSPGIMGQQNLEPSIQLSTNTQDGWLFVQARNGLPTPPTATLPDPVRAEALSPVIQLPSQRTSWVRGAIRGAAIGAAVGATTGVLIAVAKGQVGPGDGHIPVALVYAQLAIPGAVIGGVIGAIAASPSGR